MSEYSTIKELVIESCMKEGGFPSYEVLTKLVLKHFPNSKWKKTHYTWYKSKIKKGNINIPGMGTEVEKKDHENPDSDNQVTFEAGLSLDEICLRISHGGSVKSNRLLMFRLAK